MEAHTALTSEQHVSKELAQRLGQQEGELEETRQRVSVTNIIFAIVSDKLNPLNL